jgi:hypothetical protein
VWRDDRVGFVRRAQTGALLRQHRLIAGGLVAAVLLVLALVYVRVGWWQFLSTGGHSRGRSDGKDSILVGSNA